jgi:FkbM family methyltransferase
MDASRFEAYNAAVSGAEGELMFSRGNTSTTGSVQRAGFFKARSDAEVVVVSATTIESVFLGHSVERCRLLKVDCEGSEYDILTKVPDEVLDRVDNMIVEVHPTRKGVPATLKRVLEERGFEVAERPHGNGCSDLYCRRRNERG